MRQVDEKTFIVWDAWIVTVEPEEWKPIPGYEGYEASNTGRVRSLDRKDRAGRNWKGRILRPGKSDGYLTVGVAGEDGTHTIGVHRAVALAFIGPPLPPQHQVNHKNGVRDDNRPNNLEWVTPTENIRHAQEVLGHSTGARGERNSHAKLTAAQVEEIRSSYIPRKVSLQFLAKKYGVTFGAISHIVTRRTWK